MSATVSRRLETTTTFIKDIISDIRKGQVKIPQFQRKFVWKERQALDLLDSIANFYPIGSLLLWRTKDKLAVERNIGDFKLPQTDDMTPTDYVLDGQQRITVIYSCLGAPDSEEGFSVSYDLATSTFISTPKEFTNGVFPLRWLFNTTKMLDFRTGLKAHPNQATLQERLDELINSFQNYRLPIVTLKELTIEEVCPIFERINSSGTKLSIFDLMVAATWKHKEFDLNVHTESISDALEAKDFGTIERDAILKCLTAVQFDGIKKNQILSLREVTHADRDLLVSRTKEALLKAVDLLSTEFRIYSWEFLPYEAHLITLCHLYSKQKNLTGEMLVRVRQWFWRSAFNERYRVGGENFISRDLETVLKFVVEGVGDPSDLGDLPTANRLVDSQFRIANSRARAFILALATKYPRNITNGASIDVTVALSAFNKKQYHHTYPRAYLKSINTRQPIDSLMNICILTASENNTISDEDPHLYLPKYATQLGTNAEKVFASNMLPSPNSFPYATATYDDFLKERANIVATHVQKLCEGTSH